MFTPLFTQRRSPRSASSFTVGETTLRGKVHRTELGRALELLGFVCPRQTWVWEPGDLWVSGGWRKAWKLQKSTLRSKICQLRYRERHCHAGAAEWLRVVCAKRPEIDEIFSRISPQYNSIEIDVGMPWLSCSTVTATNTTGTLACPLADLAFTCIVTQTSKINQCHQCPNSCFEESY